MPGGKETDVIKISARLPDELVAALDVAAVESASSRSDLIRLAVESYLEDFDDSRRAIEVLHDPADIVLEWSDARSGLLGVD